MLEAVEGEGFLASLAVRVRLELEAQNSQALETGLPQMPPDEAQSRVRWLAAAGVLRVTGRPRGRAPEQPMPDLAPAAAEALASGNTDELYASLAEMPPDEAGRIVEGLRQQGRL